MNKLETISLYLKQHWEILSIFAAIILFYLKLRKRKIYIKYFDLIKDEYLSGNKKYPIFTMIIKIKTNNEKSKPLPLDSYYFKEKFLFGKWWSKVPEGQDKNHRLKLLEGEWSTLTFLWENDKCKEIRKFKIKENLIFQNYINIKERMKMRKDIVFKMKNWVKK